MPPTREGPKTIGDPIQSPPDASLPKIWTNGSTKFTRPKFKGPPHGPKGKANNPNLSPQQMFDLFFTNDFWAEILHQTNIYRYYLNVVVAIFYK